MVDFVINVTSIPGLPYLRFCVGAVGECLLASLRYSPIWMWRGYITAGV